MMQETDILKYVNLPRSHVYILYLLVLVIIGIGIWVSIWNQEWAWLSRFGALLIILAMLFEVLGFAERYFQKLMLFAKAANVEIVKMQVRRLPHMYSLIGNETECQINQIADKELRRRVKDVGDKFWLELSKQVRFHEFSVATIGTMLWAFADLLNKLNYWNL